ncbi:deaminase domain-containing protein [Lysinibacillus fusiformis]
MKTQIQSKVAEVKQQLRQMVRPPQQQEVSGAGVDARYIGDTGTVGRNTITPSPKPSNTQPSQNGSNNKPDEANKGTGNLSYAQKVDKYQERIQAIRDNLPSKYKKYGNVAVADVNISGLKSEFKAHSRIHKEYEGGFSYVIGEGKFPAKSVNHTGETYAPNAFLRAHDTERKILEDISRQLGDDRTVKGTIDLFTELPACGSCTDIILQFQIKCILGRI